MVKSIQRLLIMDAERSSHDKGAVHSVGCAIETAPLGSLIQDLISNQPSTSLDRNDDATSLSGDCHIIWSFPRSIPQHPSMSGVYGHSLPRSPCFPFLMQRPNPPKETDPFIRVRDSFDSRQFVSFTQRLFWVSPSVKSGTEPFDTSVSLFVFVICCTCLA